MNKYSTEEFWESQHVLQQMRSPSYLMEPRRLASIQPSRVSAVRAMINRANRQRWNIQCRDFKIDDRGRGSAVYRIEIGGWTFTFAAYSFEPKALGRTDRIIGRNWDMMGTLAEGEMSAQDVADAGVQIPLLYEGRATPDTLIWCRSNRSTRSFDHTVRALSSGRQPDLSVVSRTCYLMRNTGLDGNGTFGTKTFLAYENDHPLRWSMAAQMLCTYMMRVFGLDLINSLARDASSRAVELAPDIARYLGVGNGSGLGLVYFFNNQPKLINRWLWIREYCIAKAKSIVPQREGLEAETLLSLLERAIIFRRQDQSTNEAVASSYAIADDLEMIAADLKRFRANLSATNGQNSRSLGDFCSMFDGRICDEALETLNSLLIELVPEIADELIESLVVADDLLVQPEMSVSHLCEVLHDEYSWVSNVDLESQKSRRFVWYKSRHAEEPRRGPREEVADSAKSLALELPRLVMQLQRDLASYKQSDSVARFLAEFPQHKFTVARVQSLAGLPYHSFRADMTSEDFTPVHITLLMNLGIHGIDKGRDYLGRWVRGVLFHGAPLPEELAAGKADSNWFYPARP